MPSAHTPQPVPWQPAQPDPPPHWLELKSHTDTHSRLRHCATMPDPVGLHLMPQPPQLFTSVNRSLQTPEQARCPDPQHSPDQQRAALPQLLPSVTF
jgi:hypothetical protein